MATLVDMCFKNRIDLFHYRIYSEEACLKEPAPWPSVSRLISR